MSELQLPRLISNHMVLQRNKEIHIWGRDLPGHRVMVSFRGEEAVAQTDEKGNFSLFLQKQEAGGPFSMLFRDDLGNEEVVGDVYIGEVWFCSGQSNMELPMSRVKDRFPEDVKDCKNTQIRTFKIRENGVFTAPLTEPESGEWKSAQPETILEFSATGYYFSKALQELLKVPVGFIDASLGGSLIESWMSREMLNGMDEELALAKKYSDAAFVKGQLLKNEQQSNAWHARLDAADQGLAGHWEEEGCNSENCGMVTVPFRFDEVEELKGFIGSVWLKRTFTVPKEMAGKPAKLWLGTIVDSDVAYVNGEQVGITYYQYPPRKYEIPEGLLREGTNTIVLRVISEKAQGRFTEGKKYAIFNEQGEIPLDGTWSYCIGAACEHVPETDFVNWKPTGLYNGMTAPCHKYTIAGVNWYQGESNTHHPDNYLDLLRRMIEGYRKEWNDPKLPFQIVELPNLMVDMEGAEEGWRVLRELQRRSAVFPDVDVAVTIDLGEDNDLHPQNKKDLGKRLALLAAARLGIPVESKGPEVTEITVASDEANNLRTIRLTCSHAEGLHASSEDKGEEILDFEVVNDNGEVLQPKTQIKGQEIVLTIPDKETEVKLIRYCYRTSNIGALVYNQAGLPMSPFVRRVYEETV